VLVFFEGVQTRSKRFLEIQKLRESKKDYDVPTAISLMKQMSSAKFVESAEAHFRMNLDPKYNDQQLRATVLFSSSSSVVLFCLLLVSCCVR
jgi:ribosomal protein L1